MDRDSSEDLVRQYLDRWRSGVRELESKFPNEARVLENLLESIAIAPPRSKAESESVADYERTVSIVDSLRERVGQDVDPRIELVKDDGGIPADSGSGLLRAMRERGPASGRYDLKEEIGRGGMGAVLRVYDHELHRNLAMKVLLDGKGSVLFAQSKEESQRLVRFLEEAQVTAQLDHPGIVPVHELGIDADGRVYFTMKLVKGETLSEVFAKAQQKIDGWNQTRVLWTLLRICEAIDFAHRRKVIHRDLKPSNIMVGEFGETYVMDWGLARVLDRPDLGQVKQRPTDDSAIWSKRVFTERLARAQETPNASYLTNSGDRLGTPAYMSPEQAEGDLASIGPRTDVYSIGAILYHLLTGSAPYLDVDRPSPAAIIERVLLGPPPPIHKLARRVNAELQSICEKAMARAIPDRYASMADFAADLRAYLENRVVRAHRGGAFVELRKLLQRNRGTAFATLAAAVIAIFGLAAIAAVEFLRESDVARFDKDLQSKRSEIGRKSQDLEEKAQQLAETTTSLDAAQKALDAAKVQGDAARAEADLRKSESDRAAREIEEKSGELKRIEGDISTLREDVAARTREVDDAKARLVLQNAEIERANAESERSAGEEARAKDELGQLTQSLETIRAERERLARETQPYRDLKECVDLEAQADKLWPARSTRKGDFDEWIERARKLLEQVATYGDELPVPELRDHARTLATIRADVERRREWAANVQSLTIAAHDADWKAAIAAIADRETNPGYGGHVIEPIEGLVPLGADPISGLQEFWHAESGDTPLRDAGGALRVDSDSGIVLVLVPGATFTMGARELDFLALPEARGRRDEQPAHAVTLEPFLISKFELTQSQWAKCGGSPAAARYRQGSAVGGRAVESSNPVENVSFTESLTVLAHVGLELPTEAQWEFAARGNTETAWWCGIDGRDGWQAGNVADAYARAHGGDDWSTDAGLDDGSFVHAPVGSYRSNPFGLHDVIGNVAEWCVDRHVAYSDTVGTGARGLHEYPADSNPQRIVRGGSFRDPISDARSSARASLDPDSRSETVGIRPVLNPRFTR